MMHRATLPLREDDRVFFEEQGFLYVERYFSESEIVRLLSDIHRLIGLVLEREGLQHSRQPFDPENFDSGLEVLMEKSRKLGALIYEAVKKIPSHLILASHERNVEVAKFLLGAEFVGFASRGWGLRMDHPDEDTFLTQLHQEYVSQICSPRGLVLWSPLRNVDAETGPAVFYPRSHREGVFPIEVTGAGSYGLKIREETALERRYDPLVPEVARGDCMIMDFLLLHKSSPNRSKRTRWALLSRYFDFSDPTGRQIGWAGGLQEGNSFEKIFPELATKVRKDTGND